MATVIALVALVLACSPEGIEPEAAKVLDERTRRLTVTDPVAINTEFGRNGRAFIQDNLWTEGDEQFGVWIGTEGQPMVGRRLLGEWTWDEVDLGDLPGNPLASPTRDDPHNVFTLGVDADGYVHVAGNMHAGALRYVRSRRPRDITSWVAPTMIGKDESAATYPVFVRRPDDGLLLFYRHRGSGHSRLLANVLEPGASSWTRLPPVVDGRPTGEGPYLQHVAVDRSRGVIHIMYVWRRTTDPVTNNDISYARSVDGGHTWQSSDGTTLPSPITHPDAEVVLDTSDSGSGLINNGGMELDAAGRPHGLFRIDRSDSRPHHLHVWHDGRRWRRTRLCTPVGRGRATLFGAPSGAVFAGLFQPDGEHLQLLAVDITPGQQPQRHVLGRVPHVPWELTFDTQGLYEDDVVRTLVPGPRRSGEGEGTAVVLEIPLDGDIAEVLDTRPLGRGENQVILGQRCG